MRTSQKLSAGIDEVGRGPLAGPVVAAAVVLDPGATILGLKDSKVLTKKRREALSVSIRQSALAWAVGFSWPPEIDAINILQASHRAMERALGGLAVSPTRVQVDGNQQPTFEGFFGQVECVVGGDAKVLAISAASILAKVCRDQVMGRWDRRYPEYGFATNVGYGTAKHLRALSRIGPSPLHRKSFAPVRQKLQGVSA